MFILFRILFPTLTVYYFPVKFVKIRGVIEKLRSLGSVCRSIRKNSVFFFKPVYTDTEIDYTGWSTFF